MPQRGRKKEDTDDDDDDDDDDLKLKVRGDDQGNVMASLEVDLPHLFRTEYNSMHC